MKIFTSDLHHEHRRIVEFTNRGKDTAQEEHTEWLVNTWNKNVTKSDVCYHLGDYSFAKKYDDIAKYTSSLNGTKILLKGNHDKRENLDQLVKDNLIAAWFEYKEIKIETTAVVLFHFPVSSWHKQGHGAWHLHGHCVDDDTEILTRDGWKFRRDIKEGSEVISMHMLSGELEYDRILKIHDVNYSGKVINCDMKSLDFRFTADHDVVHKIGKNFTKIKAEEFVKRTNSVVKISGILNSQGLELSEDFVKLYILLAADGNIKAETNLCRIIVKKEHKIHYIHRILSNLKITYKVLVNSKGYSSFNFYLPTELYNYNIKGLDKKLLYCNKEQANAIVEAYEHSDGHRTGKTLLIYSAKEQEIDLLQSMLTVNGFSCNKYSRYHGFGDKLQHQLSVVEKQEIRIKPNMCTIEEVDGEHFWCVTTKNGTWIMRRNGVSMVTGNCHGNHKDGKGKMLDVGIDSAYNIYGKHRFFTEQDIATYMQDRQTYTSDHHRENT